MLEPDHLADRAGNLVEDLAALGPDLRAASRTQWWK
jgi:hypothetical protein